MGDFELPPLKYPNGGGLKNMAQSKSNSLTKKHDAEQAALDAEYAAKKAKLEHVQGQERLAAGPTPIRKVRTIPKSAGKVNRLDLSKFPKGK